MAWEQTYLLSPVLLLLLAKGSWTQDLELLRALEGQTVSVTCWYDTLYHSSEKIWCKQIDDLCYPLFSKGAEKLRYSIRQSSRLNYFTLTMTKLRMSDSGIYHCGIATKNRLIYLRTIHLVVSKGALYPVLLFPWPVDSSARHWYSLSYSLSHRSHLDNMKAHNSNS
ncbi:CMRF35-like molecule 7 isoform X3 [Mus caroli]|uniref:CMRF35-like molecule 7 isoform X3 n=1 Tax=Mus caroli TaxID=10089 RepID=A0A6P5NXK1_MUSCR|nr:CMRF35-like molecule 7 isoform X3 [Mus caroli]